MNKDKLRKQYEDNGGSSIKYYPMHYVEWLENKLLTHSAPHNLGGNHDAN